MKKLILSTSSVLSFNDYEVIGMVYGYADSNSVSIYEMIKEGHKYQSVTTSSKKSSCALLEDWTSKIVFFILGLGLRKKHNDETDILLDNIHNVALGKLTDNALKLNADAVISVGFYHLTVLLELFSHM